MELFSMVVAIVVLGILYKRMIDREVPEKIGFLQALVPVGLGAASTWLSFPLLIGAALLITYLGYDGANYSSLFFKSFMAAFVTAGAPEEVGKFLFILIALFLFRKKIDNVYEYVLVGAAVGGGFTIFEEYLYGGNVLFVQIFRLVLVGLHMLFSMTMCYYLGKAKHQRVTGKGSALVSYILAFVVPIAMHTLYDACTSANRFLEAEDDQTIFFGIVLGVVMTIVMFIAQVVMFRRFKKYAAELCGMTTKREEDKPAGVEAASGESAGAEVAGAEQTAGAASGGADTVEACSEDAEAAGSEREETPDKENAEA